MTEEVKAHETGTALATAPSAELDAGSAIALKVSVVCPANCDLQGGQVGIADDSGVIAEGIELLPLVGSVNETDEFVVRAPIKPGGYTWIAVFAAQEMEGVLHEGSSAPFAFVVKPHATSMAVWDAPSPIMLDAHFKLKVGVQCCAECNLASEKIEVYDHNGAIVATGTLGDVPWSDTASLYWTEVELEAPDTEGYYPWEVRFPNPVLELPHVGAASTFAFRTARPSEHVVMVEVIDEDTKTPIGNAQVTLYSLGTTYRSHTDDAGVTRVGVPKGAYELLVFKSDYRHFHSEVEVAGDATIKVELTYWPEVY